MGDPRLVCTIRRLRGAAGVSQADLAQQVGVSRQALVAIEAGRQNPSTLLALRLAAALGCAVEELFAVEGARTLRAAAAGPLPKERGRVVLGRVDGRWVAHPLPDPSRPGDATIQGPGGEEVLVDTVGEAAALEHNVLVAGCAPLLGVLAGRVARRYRDACATWVPANSERALDLLEAGMVHVAGLHLVESTDPRGHRAIAARRFPKSTITIVNLAVWRQGLAVARGNPLRIAAPGDVWRHKARFARREPGAGAHALARRALGRGKTQRLPAGPDASNHAEVARLVRWGVADTGITTESAALAEGLGFVPLAEERFDLLVPQARLDSRAVARVLGLVDRSAFRAEAAHLPGYDLSTAGHAETVQPRRRS